MSGAVQSIKLGSKCVIWFLFMYLTHRHGGALHALHLADVVLGECVKCLDGGLVSGHCLCKLCLTVLLDHGDLGRKDNVNIQSMTYDNAAAIQVFGLQPYTADNIPVLSGYMKVFT